MTENTVPAPITPARVAFLKSRLHETKNGYCGCGPCRLQIAVAAYGWGVTIHDVQSRLTTTTDTKQVAPVTPAPAVSRLHLTGQVGANATVTVGGRRLSALEGLLATVETVRST